jgi:hypothetical protein
MKKTVLLSLLTLFLTYFISHENGMFIALLFIWATLIEIKDKIN